MLSCSPVEKTNIITSSPTSQPTDYMKPKLASDSPSPVASISPEAPKSPLPSPIIKTVDIPDKTGTFLIDSSTFNGDLRLSLDENGKGLFIYGGNSIELDGYKFKDSTKKNFSSRYSTYSYLCLDKNGNGFVLFDPNSRLVDQTILPTTDTQSLAAPSIIQISNFKIAEKVEKLEGFSYSYPIISLDENGNGLSYTLFRSIPDIESVDIDSSVKTPTYRSHLYIKKILNYNISTPTQEIYKSIFDCHTSIDNKGNGVIVYLDNNNIYGLKILDFKVIDTPFLIRKAIQDEALDKSTFSLKLDESGSGYLYYRVSNNNSPSSQNSIELKRVENYEFNTDEHFIDVGNNFSIDFNPININKDGDGVILSTHSSQDNNISLFLKKVKNFKVISESNKSISNFLFNSIQISLNKNGDGIIVWREDVDPNKFSDNIYAQYINDYNLQ